MMNEEYINFEFSVVHTEGESDLIVFRTESDSKDQLTHSTTINHLTMNTKDFYECIKKIDNMIKEVLSDFEKERD